MHESLRDRLFSLQDTAYRDFHSRLIPNIDPERVIGIRTPALRAFAKEFSKTNEADEFLASLPHFFYEENNLHAMLLCEKKDFAETVRLLDAFLPHVDNWATCDLMRPKAFPGDDGELYAKICEWIASDHVYTVRYSLVLLMTYFLDGAFRPEYLSLAASVKSDEYYINTAIAWLFATAIAKQRESAIPFIEECRLSPWVHNTSIQKAIESYRITPEDKAYLRTLRIKPGGVR